jgi:ABC-2 type transport system permease protein
VPGLVAIIMTLIGALLTALVMAREWERGTLEALLVTPASMSEVLLGKLIAYFVLGTGGMLLTVGWRSGCSRCPCAARSGCCGPAPPCSCWRRWAWA